MVYTQPQHTLEDFLSQAEGESEELNSTHRGLEFGREEDQEIAREIPAIIGEDTEFGTCENNLDRKILDLNQRVSQTDRDKLEKVQETYAPVSRLAIIRASLAIVNKCDLDAVQLDVKTAFLNGILEVYVYMEIPEGVNTRESEKFKVCKLKKTLYGLKVSPKRWNQRFTVEVNKLGLQRDILDPCLFIWRKEGRHNTCQ